MEAVRKGDTAEWYTPRIVFEALGLHFDVDVASPVAAPVPWVPAKVFLTKNEDGLTYPWRGRVWLNPPYDRQVDRWIGRLAAHGDGIALTFARTETRWFQAAVRAASVLCLVSGRLQFVPPTGVVHQGRSPTDRPGSGSALLAFGQECGEALLRADLGVCLRLNRAVGDGVRSPLMTATGATQ